MKMTIGLGNLATAVAAVLALRAHGASNELRITSISREGGGYNPNVDQPTRRVLYGLLDG